jgi:ACS family hexuronate transporter-like MFS transporter
MSAPLKLSAAVTAVVPGREAMPPLHRQIRWWVLAALLLATIMNFVDRQSLSVVAPLLRDSLRLSATDYAVIVASFQLGMMAGEFPMGWLMDRYGARFGLSFAVVWWSLANCLHALARSLAQFSLLRFWLGTGECGNYSGGIKVVSQWFPVRERALAIGIFNGGAVIGSIIAPPLLVFITLRLGWRYAFLLPGMLGFIWVFFWLRVYRHPSQHPSVSAAELSHIRQDGEQDPAPPRTRTLLRMRQTWAVMLSRALAGPVFQFYIYWLPEYLYRERGMDLKTIGMFAWLPFLFGDLGSIGGGWAAGAMLRRGFSVHATRCVTMGFGAACCLCSLPAARSEGWQAALAFICVVLMGHTCFAANMWAVVSDVFPSNAVGRVTALTGVAAGFSGMLFPLLTGWLVDRHSYWHVFLIASVLPLAGWAATFLVGGIVKRAEIAVEIKP